MDSFKETLIDPFIGTLIDPLNGTLKVRASLAACRLYRLLRLPPSAVRQRIAGSFRVL